MKALSSRSLGARLGLLLFLAGTPAAQETYREPPADVVRIVDAPPPPFALVSPDGRRVALVESAAMPPLSLLAEPILKLGGVRITPRTNDRQRTTLLTGLLLRDLPDGAERRVAFPQGLRLGMPEWSPDGSRLALANATEKGLELWVVDAASGEARALRSPSLNGTLGNPVEWMPDSKSLLCRVLPEGRGPEPPAPLVPAGPRIEETRGKVSKVRTYQDLLESARDEALFDHYMTAQLALLDARDGALRRVGSPAIFASVEPSPGGGHLLVVRLHRPYSRAVPYADFPRAVEVWDLEGRLVHRVADLPVSDEVPIEGVPTGPRSVTWRPLEPSTLVWTEALDGGDPEKKVPHRDRCLRHAAPFEGEAVEFARLEHRFAGIEWLERKDLALVVEYDRDRRWRRTRLLEVEKPPYASRLVWDLSVNDRYRDPGRPVSKTTPRGESVVRVAGDAIFLSGQGATKEGDRPFLDRLPLDTLETARVFRCEEGTYESFVDFVGPGTGTILTRRESPKDPPNYFVRDLERGARAAITDFRDPAPEFTAGVEKKLLRYARKDGVPLSGTLYLPPGRRSGERLPLLVWAYPLEYTDPGTAGQVRSAPTRFTFLRGASQLLFLTQGYAVLDDAQLPIIGDPKTVNDTFVEQLVDGARAAIDAAAAEGAADPDRVGVGGHSYGAFMTANLLARCDLFRAGIARSGAYNRTLTPFGFQSERRTLWEAPEVYVKLSPFLHADKIRAPILLIHGEEDNNPGTFPLQSERLFHALRGHGATARLVLLPHESHGYQGRESVLHVLAEMFDWFDRHVKNAPPRPATGGGEGEGGAGRGAR
ncbi:MAG TPA: prolyl oligopeptidase family serine peptidase [Planctomycetota bacterium]|jgi:dipeptidyl aminopeptidase/acylaminoacyl peptidase|nr:prolyl oligopeptidase family serine peptidase [Planctomycetota bacterium]